MTRPDPDALIRDLLEGNRGARDSAALALRGLRFDVAKLAPVLAHPHVSRQIKAIEVLRVKRCPEAVALVVPMLASTVSLVARKAATTLGSIGHTAPELVATALDTAASDDHRLQILEALSRMRDPRGREALIVEADSWHVGRRKAALECLRRYRDDPPIETIIGAIHDRDTREEACEIAGKLRHPAFLVPLIDAYFETESFRIAWAISLYGPDALPPLFARAATAARGAMAEVIERCLWRPEVRKLFWSVLWRRSEPAIRDACLAHLGRGYAEDYVAVARREALDEHARDPDVRRRRALVQGYYRLARAGGPHGKHAREVLVRWAKHSDVATDAQAALNSLQFEDSRRR